MPAPPARWRRKCTAWRISWWHTASIIIAGFETNRINQLVVRPTLQTTHDDIFAIGDCAACPQPGRDIPVPPTARAAHQQAALLVRSIARRFHGKALPSFTYRDRSSLISLSHYTTVDSLMGNLTGDVMIEGRFARLFYRLHQRALRGMLPMLLLMFSDFPRHRTAAPGVALNSTPGKARS